MVNVFTISPGGGKEHGGQYADGRVAAASSPSPVFCLQRLQRPHARLCTHHRGRHSRHDASVMIYFY